MLSDRLRRALQEHGSERIIYAADKLAGIEGVNPDDYQGPLNTMLAKAASDMSRRLVANQINNENRMGSLVSLCYYKTLR
jgi:hypothetical protein